MKSPCFIIVTTITCILLWGCAPTEKSLRAKGFRPLTEAEVKSLFSGTRTIKWHLHRDVSGTTKFTNNGIAKATFGGTTYKGFWRITNGKFCTKFKKLRYGNESCYIFYKTDNKKYEMFIQQGPYYGYFSFIN